MTAILLAAALLLVGAAAGLLLAQRGSPASPGPDAPDVGFAQDMSVHHENAVEMATWARGHTSDSAVRQLAYDIESGQTNQIGQMRGWLSLWGAPMQSAEGYMRWMIDMSAGSTMPDVAGGSAVMPGIASQQDLRRLRATTGSAADVLFLQLMLRHHEGGAAMLRYAADQADLPPVANLARQMLAAQTAESELIRRLLAQRGAAPLGG